MWPLPQQEFQKIKQFHIKSIQNYGPVVDCPPVDEQLTHKSYEDEHLFMFRKKNGQTPRATIIHLPGNVHVYDISSNIHGLCRNLLAHMKENAQVVYLKYPAGPGYLLPQMVDQLYQSFDYLINKAADFQINLTQIYLMGYSSGAALIPGLIHHALKSKIQIKKNVFISPFLDFTGVSQSKESVQKYLQKQQGDKLDGNFYNRLALALAIQTQKDLSDPRWIPIHYSVEDLAQLGKIDFLMPKYDAFYRSTMAFYQKLSSVKGVNGDSCVRLIEFDDITHLNLFLVTSVDTPEQKLSQFNNQKTKNLIFFAKYFDSEIKS